MLAFAEFGTPIDRVFVLLSVSSSGTVGYFVLILLISEGVSVLPLSI